MIETIQSCSLVIVDLFNSTAEDLHFLMQALKVDMKQTPPKPSGELEQPVTVILISSLNVWSNTPSEEGVLRDSDWQRRKPAPGSEYEQWRELENMVLTTFNQEESQIKGFVVAGGALYGEGEDTFGRLFKDAWCGIQDHVISAPGENRIPMVHVRDLSRLVRQLAFYSPDVSPMETPYFLAVDQPPAPPERAPPPPPVLEQAAAIEDDPSKDELVAAQEGEGADDEELQQEAREDELEPQQEATEEEVQPEAKEAEEAEDGGEEAQQEKPKSKPSTQALIVQGIVDEMAEHYDVPVVEPSSQAATAEPDADFPSAQDTLALNLVVEPSKVMLDEEFAAASEPPGWWCREGMLANARKIAGEFCVQRELRAVRVVVAGPPASGKSTLCKAISAHFRIPCLGLDPKDLDATTAQLSGNVCRYRGFVLDAGLAGFEEVEKLFCYDAEVERGDDEEEEEAAAPEDPEDGEEGGAERPKVKMERRINMELCPEFVVATQAPEPLCRARFKQQRGAAAVEAFELQHQHYAGLNLSDQPTFSDFFHDVAKIGVFNLPVAGKDEEDMFESARIYIEKAGRPFNYLPSEAEVTAEILARLAKKEQRGASPGSKAAGTTGPADESDDEFFTGEDREALIAAHLEEHARLQEVPLREYLMRCMIPTLTEGLIEMCKVLPDNPADYLATYVESHAADPPAEHLSFDFR